jgi:hypothetical protein
MATMGTGASEVEGWQVLTRTKQPSRVHRSGEADAMSPVLVRVSWVCHAIPVSLWGWWCEEL